VIGFEFNGGHAPPSGGWESAEWQFTDGLASQSFTFNEVDGTGSPTSVLVKTGSISGSSYQSFFGLNPVASSVVSFILLRAPSNINVFSPNFRVRVGGLVGVSGFGEGTPDPDVIGVLIPPE
jgi:hypothetical protein